MSDQLTYPVEPAAAAQAVPTERRWSSVARWALVLGLLALAFWLGAAPLTAVPAAQTDSAPPADFSAARAMDSLAFIAAEPRPTGSPQAAAVADFLVRQLESYGYAPEVQASSLVRGAGGEGQVLAVRNVIARLEGVGDGPALLLSGHYDSVATSPGASDCGQCAAVVLEAARALKAGPPPPNDIIFVFTDGEEVGVAGASAFVEGHPWAGEVGLSVVVEGYGNGAASMMYVTGEESGGMQQQAVRLLDGATRYPVAYSFVHQMMWVLAGNTGSDLDAFLEASPGLGLIYLSFDTSAAYHTAADDVARIDPRSVQHQGEVAVGLARGFDAGAAERLSPEPDEVIFPLWPGTVARYAGSVALPLAGVVALLLLALLLAGVRRGAWRPRGILAGLLLWPLALIAAVVLTTVVWWLARYLTPALRGMTVGGWYGAGWFLAAVAVLSLGVYAALYAGFRRRLPAADLYAAAMVWWAALALLTAVAMPGWSYLFVWPLAVAIVVQAMLWAIASRPRGAAVSLLAALPAVVGLWLLASVALLLWIYAGRMEAIMGIPTAWLPLIIGGWLFGLLLPALEPLSPRDWGRLAGLASLAAVALFVAGAVAVRPSAARPMTDSITYRANADTGEAAWIAVNDSRAGRGTNGQLDDWTAQFFPGGVEAADTTVLDVFFHTSIDTPFPALSTPAQWVERPLSSLTLQGPSGRFRSLALAQADGSELTQVRFASESPISSVTINGEPMPVDPGLTEWLLNVYGRPGEPVAIDIATESTGRLTAGITDAFLGLPTDAGIDIRPRPAHLMPAPLPDVTDRTLIEHTVVLEP